MTSIKKGVDPKQVEAWRDSRRGGGYAFMPHQVIEGVKGTGGGLLGKILGGAGGMLGGLLGGGGDGGGIDLPHLRNEVIPQYLDMLQALEEAGVLGKEPNATKALAAYRERLANQAKLQAKYRGQSIAKYAPGYRESVRDELIRRGLDPKLAAEHAQIQSSELAGDIPAGITDARKYFGTEGRTTALSNVEDALRQRVTNRLNAVLTPGLSRTMWADTADDPILNRIASTQQTEATDALNRARARGTLSNEGYAAALKDVLGQRAGVMSRLSSTGGSVLSGYRGDIDALSKTLRDEAMVDPYRSATSPLGLKAALDERLAGQRSSLSGDISNAIGSTPLFNVNTALQRGATGQGVINPASLTSATGLRAALVARNKLDARSRGLGSTGVF